MKFSLQLVLMLFVCSISACKKEKLISIDPFASMTSPVVVVDKQTAKISVQLGDYSYDEVGISYGETKTEIAMGALKKTLVLQKNAKEYTGIISPFDETGSLYYRIYVKLSGKTVLSDIYEITAKKFSLRRKDPNKWIIPDEKRGFKVVLLGENIDTDINQYKVKDDQMINMAITKLIKGESGTTEIHVNGQLSAMNNNRYIGFTLLYKNKEIHWERQIKIAQPKGFGHYSLKRINGNSNNSAIGFTHNNEFYTIGVGMIQKYDFVNNIWYREKEIDQRFVFNLVNPFKLRDTLFLNGYIHDDQPFINYENNKAPIVTLDLKRLSVNEEYIQLDKIFPSYRNESLIHYYHVAGKMIAILTVTDPDTYVNHNYLYVIDWNSRKGRFVANIDGKMIGRIFEYNGKAYGLYNQLNSAGENFYTLSEFNPNTGDVKPIKSFPNIKTYFFHHSVHNDDLILVGKDRIIAKLNLKDFSMTSFEHYYESFDNSPLVVLDHEEVSGQVFYVNQKYYFGMGFHTVGTFEFSFVNYE